MSHPDKHYSGSADYYTENIDGVKDFALKLDRFVIFLMQRRVFGARHGVGPGAGAGCDTWCCPEFIP